MGGNISMTRYTRRLLFALFAAAATVRAAGLPDTGMSQCDAGLILFDCTDSSADFADSPRQDGRFGRDAKVVYGALSKAGAGSAGFDYTKVANNGSDLAPGIGLGAGPDDWACTRDNITGLTWEVKVNDATGLRHSQWTYTWFDSDSTSNGGNSGTAAGGTCLTASRCDTGKFVADVNAATLCGRSDWRLPTARELLTIVHFGATNRLIDPVYFPNSLMVNVWTGSTYAANASQAWVANFGSGQLGAGARASPFGVRLVRGARF